MWTRQLLKSNAKNALKRYYWKAFLITLVTVVLCGQIRMDIEIDVDAIKMFIESNFSITSMVVGLITAFAFVVALGRFLFSIFVGSVLEIGQAAFFVRSRNKGEAEPFSVLFCGFQDGYLNHVFILFLRELKVFLWSLLFILPGIVKRYEYAMIPYLLADDPSLSKDEAFAISRQMMEGHKTELFILDLSFIGWYLLGALCFGIGTFFVYPYQYATHAEFYTAIKETMN